MSSAVFTPARIWSGIRKPWLLLPHLCVALLATSYLIAFLLLSYAGWRREALRSNRAVDYYWYVDVHSVDPYAEGLHKYDQHFRYKTLFGPLVWAQKKLGIRPYPASSYPTLWVSQEAKERTMQQHPEVDD